MTWPDVVNGLFELIGAVCVWFNVYRLRRDRQVRGVFWPLWAFFASWGIWNLYYYPSLGQWASTAGGIVMVLGNITWVIVAWRYRRA